MKLSRRQVELSCRRAGISISQLLEEAGVSPNAYYTLARKPSIVPRSLDRIAERLDVPVSQLLEPVPTEKQRMERLAAESHRIARRHRGSDRDNIRHTLLLLEQKPIERLRRSLLRGRPIDLR